MSRGLKFRVWDTEKKEFFKPVYEAYKGNLVDLSISLNGRLLRRSIELAAEDESNFQGRYKIQQFVGLKDINGKKIYEGDIVEWDDNSMGKWRRRCAVGWEPSHYTLDGYFYDIRNPENKTPIDFVFGAFMYESDGLLEVIGNIYENPELLKPIR